MSSGTSRLGGSSQQSGDLRVQLVNHRDGRRSYVILDVGSGSFHARADLFLASFGEGTQRTYAYHLVDHLRWLAVGRLAEEAVTIEDLRRYVALCGAEHAGPLGVPWRERPLSEAALAVRATCLKGYYLDLTMREDVNPSLCAELSARRLANHRDRDRSVLGHLVTSVASNPLTRGAPPRRHPRLLPDGARDGMLAAVRTTRDRMIVTWLSDSGMRIGELCGLWFCDLHLRADHRCGERAQGLTRATISQLAGVSRSFTYENDDARAIIAAAQTRSQARAEGSIATITAQQEASWRERALNAEDRTRELRGEITTQRRLVSDLTGQLREPDGTWIEHDRNRLRHENEVLLLERNQLVRERAELQRKLDGARANVSRLNEQRVT
ncbi:MAG: hypothetical protein ACLP8S_10535 [Solirubrobacteraceae bacterium]